MKLLSKLQIERCPHCNIALPSMNIFSSQSATKSYAGGNLRFWATYQCSTCGGVVLACSYSNEGSIAELYPNLSTLEESIPERAREYLRQSIESLHAPAGAVVLAASSIDAMLKNKNYKDGSLYSRIDKAAENHLITKEMALWAHEVRLEANEQRHADESSPLPKEEDAKRVIEFTKALAQLLFVLPARIQKGLQEIKK